MYQTNSFPAFKTTNFNAVSAEEQQFTGIEQIVARLLFEQLFSNKSIIEKNKDLILILQNFIKEKNFKTLNGFLADSAIGDLHVSLLKSILIMTEHVPEVSDNHPKVQEIFYKKMQNC